MDQIYDYLITLNAVTSQPDNDPDQQIQTNTMFSNDSTKRGRIIHFYWATYDVKKKIVTDECEYYVKPYKFTELTPETVERTQITNEQMNANGVLLSDVIHKFNEALYLNYTNKNASFCLVTNGDDLLMNVLPRDTREIEVRLQTHFFSYFDINEEFKRAYSSAFNCSSLKDYLGFLKLKETVADNLGQVECKSMLRLVHRLIADGYKFQNPKVLNPLHQLISTERPVTPVIQAAVVVASQENQNPNQIQNQSKKWASFINGKSPDVFRVPDRKWYIRMRGLPYAAREPEIIEFLRGIRVSKEDITFLYDYEGKFTGEAYIQLYNEADAREAVSYNMSDLGNRYIEIFETNESEFNKAKSSQFPEKRELRVETTSNLAPLISDEVGIIRMRGLPYSCTEEDIKEFFRGFNIVKDGIKRATMGGRPSGECFVIFETKEQAYEAMTLNMEKIGTRFIELFSSNVREFENYMHHNFSNTPSYSRENVPNIPLEKRKSTLMMIGLPFNVSKAEIIKFFSNFGLKDSDIYLISGHNGKFSGNALITFEDELEAQKALKTKNLSYINNRYVELYEYR